MRFGPLLSVLIVLPLLVRVRTRCGDRVGRIGRGRSGAKLLIFHRTPFDMAVSAVSGRDCSVVYLDRLEAYCRPRELAPERPVFCTRSLGVPDCWADPAKLPDHPREIADGPRTLTPEQDRAGRWPGLW